MFSKTARVVELLATHVALVYLVTVLFQMSVVQHEIIYP